MRQAKEATVRRRANRSPVALALAVCCALALMTSQAAQAISADAESRFKAEMGAVVSAIETAPMGIFSKISLRGHLRTELRKDHQRYPEQPMPVEAIQRVIGRLAEMKVEAKKIAQAAAALDLAAKTGASAEMVAALSDTLTGGTKAEAQEVIGAYAHISAELRARAEMASDGAENPVQAQKLVRDAADLFRETLESGSEVTVHLIAGAVGQARAQSIALGELVTELRAAVKANLHAEALKTRVDQIMARLRLAVRPAGGSASGGAGARVNAGAGSQASGEAGAGQQRGAAAGVGLSAGAGASASGSAGKAQVGAGGKAGLNVSVGAGAE